MGLDMYLKSNKRGEGQLNLTVRFAGVSFVPGQYLYADENGIVVANRNLSSNQGTATL